MYKYTYTLTCIRGKHKTQQTFSLMTRKNLRRRMAKTYLFSGTQNHKTTQLGIKPACSSNSQDARSTTTVLGKLAEKLVRLECATNFTVQL